MRFVLAVLVASLLSCNTSRKTSSNELKVLPAAEGVTAERVIENYLEAIGGRSRLQSVEDMHMVMAANFNGVSLKTEIDKKAPDKMRTVTFINGSPATIQIYDGESGSFTQQGKSMPVEEEMLAQFKATAPIFIELQYEELGYQLNLEGIEKLGENKAYKVRVTDPLGSEFFDYYDLESGLKVRSITGQGDKKLVTQYSNYQELEGIKMPFTIKTSLPVSLEMAVHYIEINQGLGDELFEPE